MNETSSVASGVCHLGHQGWMQDFLGQAIVALADTCYDITYVYFGSILSGTTNNCITLKWSKRIRLSHSSSNARPAGYNTLMNVEFESFHFRKSWLFCVYN